MWCLSFARVQVRVMTGKKRVSKAAIEAVLGAAQAAYRRGVSSKERIVGFSIRYGAAQKTGPPRAIMVCMHNLHA